MMDDDVTSSLLEEYSIAEMNLGSPEIQVDEIQRESHEAAFSRYARVIFHDIADSYPTDADIVCCFSLTPDLKRKEGDLVAMFRLGWRNPEEIITSLLVPKPMTPDQCDFEVQFKASTLPKEEQEVFQLCYMSQGEVKGASVPFEFRRATVEELLVVDNGDIAIVRSQPAIAQDLKRQLTALRKELAETKSRYLSTKEKLKEVEEHNEWLKGRLKDLEKVEQVLERLRADNNALDKERNDSQDALRNAELHIISLNSTVAALQKDVECLRKQVIAHVEQIAREDAAAKVAAERSCSLEMIDALREGKEVAVREMRAALSENEKLRLQLILATDEKRELLQQVDDEQEKLIAMKEQMDAAGAAHAKRIEGLLVQLTRLTSDAQHRVNAAKEETEQLRKRVVELEADLMYKDEEILRMRYAQNPSQESSSLQQTVPSKTGENTAEWSLLQTHLHDVQERHAVVCQEMTSLDEEITGLQKTEESLQESRTRLTKRVSGLENIVADAECCGNTMEASLHLRELSVARSKLEEKLVCIESAQARHTELQEQMEELKQERAVLAQQETQATDALSSFMELNILSHKDVQPPAPNFTSGPEQSSEAAPSSQTHSSLHRAAEAWNAQVEAEVSELRERLCQAAEAYKTLYQQKLQAERRLLRLQEQERHCELAGTYQ